MVREWLLWRASQGLCEALERHKGNPEVVGVA